MMRVPENSTWNKLEHGLDEAAKTAKVKICEKAVAEKAKQIPSRSKNRERNTKQRRARPSSPSITSLLQCLPCNGLSMSCPWLFRSKKLFTSNPSKPSHPPSSPPLPARQHTPSSHPGTTLIHSRPMPTPPLNTDHWESNRQAALPRVASNTFGRPPPHLALALVLPIASSTSAVLPTTASSPGWTDLPALRPTVDLPSLLAREKRPRMARQTEQTGRWMFRTYFVHTVQHMYAIDSSRYAARKKETTSRQDNCKQRTGRATV